MLVCYSDTPEIPDNTRTAGMTGTVSEPDEATTTFTMRLPAGPKAPKA